MAEWERGSLYHLRLRPYPLGFNLFDPAVSNKQRIEGKGKFNHLLKPTRFQALTLHQGKERRDRDRRGLESALTSSSSTIQSSDFALFYSKRAKSLIEESAADLPTS